MGWMENLTADNCNMWNHRNITDFIESFSRVFATSLACGRICIIMSMKLKIMMMIIGVDDGFYFFLYI